MNVHSISRRELMRTMAVAGASMAVPAAFTRRGHATEPSDTLSVALIGAGAQGRILMEDCLKIKGIRFRAVCDIWAYSQQYAGNYLKKLGQEVAVYEDYRDLLAKEKGLDACIVATPDWMHAEHAIACMDAGCHVYCEKEMSNSLEKAREMVLAARRTNKKLQIGHQRRSNPRYIHAIDTLIRNTGLLGRVTHANAQWNRSKSDDLGWPAKYAIPPATLEKYGYEDMLQFRNWRWFKKYGGGPIVDLGSHQIDLFGWLWNTPPKSVTACGGIDFYKSHEWYDNVMCIYEYETPQGTNRAFYQVLTTTKHGGFCETFMGEDGTLVISEVPQAGNTVEREDHAKPWDVYVKQGLLLSVREAPKRVDTKNVFVDVRVSVPMGSWPLPVELAKPAHQPHLENFFDAVRTGAALNCPAEVAYESAVAVLAANEAVRTGQRIEFRPEDFKV